MTEKKKIIKPEEYARLSKVKIQVSRNKLTGQLHEMNIKITGLLANIPSLKNAKIPGKNFLAPTVINKLKALTWLYQNATSGNAFKFNPKDRVFITCLLTNNSRTDTDNVLSAIKDWLEPDIKNKKSRKFGIGLIQNDKNANGIAFRANEFGIDNDYTLINIRWINESMNNDLKIFCLTKFEGNVSWM